MRHLESYYIFAKEWRSIKLTNGAEGGMEGFFASAKTTKQLVENLLIPCVEEVLFKTEGSSTELAQSFRGYFDSLKRIPELENNLKDFKAVREGGEQVLEEVRDLSSAQEQFHAQKSYLRRVSNHVNVELDRNRTDLNELEDQLAQLSARSRELNHYLDSLLYVHTLAELGKARQQEQNLKLELAGKQQEGSEADHRLRQAKGENYYLDIRECEGAISSWQEAKLLAGKGHEELVAHQDSCRATLRKRLSERQEEYGQTVAGLEEKIAGLKQENKSVAEQIAAVEAEVAEMRTLKGGLEKEVEYLENRYKKVWQRYQNLNWLEDPGKALEELQAEINGINAALAKNREDRQKGDAEKSKINLRLQELAGLIAGAQKDVEAREKDLETYNSALEDYGT